MRFPTVLRQPLIEVGCLWMRGARGKSRNLYCPRTRACRHACRGSAHACFRTGADLQDRQLHLLVESRSASQGRVTYACREQCRLRTTMSPFDCLMCFMVIAYVCLHHHATFQGKPDSELHVWESPESRILDKFPSYRGIRPRWDEKTFR